MPYRVDENTSVVGLLFLLLYGRLDYGHFSTQYSDLFPRILREKDGI